LLRDASLDTNIVTQNKQNKLRTAARILTFFFSLFLFLLFPSFVLVTTTFFFSSKIFFELQELLLFFLFFLPLYFFQQQHKDLVHKNLEQMVTQIYVIFRLAPSTNMGQSLGGSGDDQL
jgi:uncharacterized protein YqhQ